MSADKKSRDVAPKKPISENKAVEAKAVQAKGVEAKGVEAKAVETKTVEAKAADPKAETSLTIESKPDAAPKKQGMGEGQKAVTKAYKNNWNDIFGKKKKR
jgi:hypothetical protein